MPQVLYSTVFSAHGEPRQWQFTLTKNVSYILVSPPSFLAVQGVGIHYNWCKKNKNVILHFWGQHSNNQNNSHIYERIIKGCHLSARFSFVQKVLLMQVVKCKLPPARSLISFFTPPPPPPKKKPSIWKTSQGSKLHFRVPPRSPTKM